MSLIQEALKRQQQEFEGTAKPPDAVGATTPTEIAPTSEQPPAIPPPSKEKAIKKKEPKAWGMLVGSLVVLVVLAGSAIFFFMVAAKSWKKPGAPTPAAVVKPEASASASTAQSTLIQPIRKAEEVVRKVQDARSMAVPAEASSAAAPITSAPNSSATAKAPANKESPEPAKKATLVLGMGNARNSADAAQESSSSSDSSGQAIWPKLTLTGVMLRSTEKDSTALINKAMVSVDETVEGARLLEVHSGSVELEYEGETRTLFVGQSTF
ncbi:MAG TPA: hypothetical protein DCZ95_17370 [Verrucomicrobia bacterium]|nr:MAG: hypothetical protein A2X46_17440 [Lentisphaerae bacterium GWF2_57_35]HBA85856.1 hypothetical protein [Verrucomicrobiota bacterium]